MSLPKKKDGSIKSHKNRRGYKRKYNVKNSLKIVGANANGISSKLQSLSYIVTSLDPSIICLQETKVRNAGKVKINNYSVFELVRKNSAGGGLATIIKNDLEPVWISEGDDTVEMLVVELHIKNLSIRIINAYGPQECDNIERKTLFWAKLQTEVDNAFDAGAETIIQMDGNLHCGDNIIKGDPNTMNANGKMFAQFLQNNCSLFLLNSSEKCEGLITRKRVKGNKTEQAILDFVLVSDNILPYFNKMIIDEERKYALTSYLNGKVKTSDHFTEIVDFNINFMKQKPIREEHFNFKNSECQEIFKNILDSEDNLVKCLDNSDDLDIQVDNWFKELNKIFHRSFKKIRVSNKIKETESSQLFQKRSLVIQSIKKNPNDEKLKAELEDIESDLSKVVGKENHEKIYDTFKTLDQNDGENFVNGIWNIKKKEFPKISASVPSAKVDVNGRMISDPNGIKNLYLETFQHRLRERPIKAENSDLFELQQKLVKKRLLITAHNKTPPWSENDVISALKSLKNGKCRDPLGLINEIFKPEVAGKDLISSLTIIMNKVKENNKIPALFRLKNISTIYKNKGSRADLENDRGVFICTVFNTILQKLIYKETYETIDSNLTDSNVGSRKNKNIRNHSFVINGIIQDTINKNKSVDLAILDFRQCFDAMSVDVTTNDLYNNGVTNDQLNLMNQCDASSLIAVKTPVGITKRVKVKKVVAQGEVMSNLKCTVSVDSISEKHEQNLHDHLYKYKQKVEIMPLGMVDDQVGVSNCGLDSALSTAHLNAQAGIKKLQFGEKKCKKMHIGKRDHLCPDITIDTWRMVPSQENISSILELVDNEGDSYVLSSVSSEKYLGDILQSNGKNDKNIEERMKRGSGAVNQICQMLHDLCLGSFYFEAAGILRDSLLLSSLLSNSESWYNLSDRDIKNLESIDEQLIRRILNAHSKTPIELLYLETGSIPIRFILMSRRLNFLWYILDQKSDSLLSKFFEAQCQDPVKSDWVHTVKQDLNELNIMMNFDDIKKISKAQFKNFVKEKVKKKALEYLSDLQKTHSKSINLTYDKITLQDYLKPNNSLSIKEKCFIFSARSRMIDVKCNFKLGFKSLKCRKCGIDDEDQKHLLQCPSLLDSDIVPSNNIPKYEDLFCANSSKIEIIGKVLLQKYKVLQSPNTKNNTMCTVNNTVGIPTSIINTCAAVVYATDLD